MNVKFSTKVGGRAGGQPKIWGIHGPPRPPLEPPLGNTRAKHSQLPAIIWNFYYDAKKLLQADDCIMTTSNYSDSLVKPKLFACVVSEHIRLKGNIGRICFYPTTRYFQVLQLR